jgi:hypothetical protein
MRTASGILVLCAVIVGACAPATGEPQFPSSAGQTTYAADYPAALQALANEQANAETQVHSLTAQFAKFPDQLKDPPWDKVQTIVLQADQAGSGQGYFERQRNVDQVREFFTNDKDEIVRKVGGAVQYQAKQKNYELDVYGTVGASMKDAVDKQLEKRLRAASDAQLTIERYRDTLGKNAPILEKQAYSIALASYLANTGLAMVRSRVTRLSKEADPASKTLDQGIKEEQALQAETGRTASEKKSSQERQARLQDARNRIDQASAQANTMLKDLEQRDAAIQKEYKDAIDGLTNAVAAKAQATKK